MNCLYYLLEANLYLVVFYGFYYLFLQKETFHTVNRYYLIIAALTSFALPFLQMSYLNGLFFYKAPIVSFIHQTELLQDSSSAPSRVKTIHYTWTDCFATFYILISAFFAVKLIIGLLHVISLSRVGQKTHQKDHLLIETEGSGHAFSFFNLLYIDPLLNEKELILKHEMVHIRQKHSIDVLIIELLQIISWFNPIVYILKIEIKLIHEYLVDTEITKKDIEKHHYALFLINYTYALPNLNLTNQLFNQSILKRRISMLNQETTPRAKKLRTLLTLPLICGMICISTMAFTKDYGFIDLLPKSKLTIKKSENYENNDLIITDKLISLSIDKNTTQEKINTYKTDLEKRKIFLNIEKIGFDTDNTIKFIKLAIDCNDGFKGSVEQDLSQENQKIGFYRIYDKNALSPFGMSPSPPEE